MKESKGSYESGIEFYTRQVKQALGAINTQPCLEESDFNSAYNYVGVVEQLELASLKLEQLKRRRQYDLI